MAYAIILNVQKAMHYRGLKMISNGVHIITVYWTLAYTLNWIKLFNYEIYKNKSMRLELFFRQLD